MPRIVHLGFGNFHRAHQAWYTQRVNELGGSQWSITGVSMRRADLRDALKSSSYSYALGFMGAEGLRVDHLTVHDEILVASQEPEAVIKAIALPETQVVTLTITEKGYALDATGRLDLQVPAIEADFAAKHPTSGIGLLTRGLYERSHSGAPVTVMSCDNLSGNGSLLQQAVLDFAQAAGWDMAGYLAAHVTFPDSMVDRITPATTKAAISDIAQITGKIEPAPVITETFSEWVIEDRFAGARPDWNKVGAVFADDVTPFEARKLRLLNGAHSLLAYGGLLKGHNYVHEAIRDAELRQNVHAFWDEAIVTLPAEIQSSCAAYCEALTARFEVPAIRHELRQIAMDGSMKLPVRIIATAQARAKMGQSSPALCGALSSWFAFACRNGIVDDPKATELTALLQGRTPSAASLSEAVQMLNWNADFPFSATDLETAALTWFR